MKATMPGAVLERAIFSVIQAILGLSGQVKRETFADGVIFTNLVIKMGDIHKIRDFTDTPKNKTEKKDNVRAALKLMKLCNITDRIRTDDVLNGTDKFMNMLEDLFLFGINKQLIKKGFNYGHNDALENFKQWINAKLSPDVRVNNFTSDWFSGANLGALIDFMSPGLCPDWRHFQAINNIENINRLMHIAEEHFRVLRVVSATEICDQFVEPLTIALYLSQFIDAETSSNTNSGAHSGGSFISTTSQHLEAVGRGSIIVGPQSGCAAGNTWVARGGNHANVITMMGMLLVEQHPTECALIPVNDRRDLQTFLETQSCSEIQLLRMGLDITKGVKYLTDRRKYLPLINSRNCILSEDRSKVFVVDYSSVLHVLPGDYFMASSDKYESWRWKAIEILVGDSRHVTEMSHVWSIAIIFYEMFMRGRRPYSGQAGIVTEHQLREWLNQGRRLEKPPAAPVELYNLMMTCWKPTPRDRPTLDEMISILDHIMSSVPRSRSYSTQVSHNYGNDPDATKPKTLQGPTSDSRYTKPPGSRKGSSNAPRLPPRPEVTHEGQSLYTALRPEYH